MGSYIIVSNMFARWLLDKYTKCSSIQFGNYH